MGLPVLFLLEGAAFFDVAAEELLLGFVAEGELFCAAVEVLFGLDAVDAFFVCVAEEEDFFVVGVGVVFFFAVLLEESFFVQIVDFLREILVIDLFRETIVFILLCENVLVILLREITADDFLPEIFALDPPFTWSDEDFGSAALF